MRLRLTVLIAVLLSPAPALAQQEVVEYYALDAIGSVRVVFNPDGTVKGRMDYMPFGGELQPAVGLPPEAFAGLFRDPEAGLDHAQARSYQVRTGRFNRPDPVYAGLFDPQQWNRYSYAVNSPMNFTDKTGLQCKSQKGLDCFSSGNAPGPKKETEEGDEDDGGGDDTGPEITIVIDIGGIFALPNVVGGGASAVSGTGAVMPPTQTPPTTTPTGKKPDDDGTDDPIVDWKQCFAEHRRFSVRAANMSVLDILGTDRFAWARRAPGVPDKTGEAAAVVAGISGATANQFRLVTPLQAAKSFVTNGGWTGAVLTPRGTLMAAGANAVVAGALGWGAYQAGAQVGALAYATGQTLAGNCP